MERILLLLKNNLQKGIYAIPAAFLLLVLLTISTATRAQVVYSMGEPGNTSAATSGDLIKKMNYDGTNVSTVITGTNAGLIQPYNVALDGNNNRIFVSEANLAGNVIKVITGSSVTSTITSANSAYIKAIDYDVVGNWLYYITEGGDITQNTANDALYRVHPDGTGSQTVAASITKNPYRLEVDAANNKVYVVDVSFSGRSIKTVDLANSNAVTSRAFATTLSAVYDVALDKVTGYLYYCAEGGNAATLSATDQVRRQNIDGTGDVQIAASVCNSPFRLGLDAGNNRLYVGDAYFGSGKIVAINLTNNTFSTTLAFATGQNFPQLYDFGVPDRPTVTTATAGSVTATSATLGGTLVYGYGLSTERGVVYSSTNTVPTVSDTKGANATVTTNGAYSASVTGLSPSTTYYARAYAVNGAGTTYGAVVTFATLSNDANLSAFTISSGTLTPAFAAGTTSYTASVTNATTSITVTPTRNQANATIKVNTVAVTSGSASGNLSLAIGNNTISTVVTAQDASTKTYTLTVNRPKAAQTITFNALTQKNYGDADFAPGATASSGLTVSYASSDAAVATIVNGKIHIVASGTVDITASQAGDGNYLAATSVVQSFTVKKVLITITANAASKTYGNADPSFTYSITSGALVGSDAFTGTLTRDAGVNFGSYNITQGTVALSTSKYTLTFLGAAFNINKRAITIQSTPVNKVYGDNDPAFTYTATGVVGTDAPSGALSRVSPTTNIFIGTYAIDQGTLSYGNNYNATYVGANLTINKRPITVLPSAKTKVYGAADPFLNQFQTIAGSLAPGDATSDQFGRAAGESVGTYLMTLGTKKFVSGGGITDVTANYDITVQPAYVTITAKPITVTATAQTKNYGDTDPTLAYSNSGLAFSDAFTGALTRAPGNNVGTYAITQGSLALNSNYTLTFNGANLTIGTKTINVTANAQTKTYGTADPALTYTNDALSFSDSFTGSLTRAAGEGAGTHAITQGNLALSSNYTLNYTGANLTIGKATLSYVATPASRPYQTTEPTYTGSVAGFVSGDNQASATTGTLGFTTTANLNSPQGSYAINGSGLSANNYDFVQAAANSTALTITASVDATLAGLTVDQGTLNPVFSTAQTSYGFSVANNVASFNLTATANQQNATLTLNGIPLTSGISANVPLNTGPNNINVLVTAQDGTTTKYYTLNVFRAYDTNNLLTSLNLSGVTFSPVFDTNTLNYTATVGNLVSSTGVTATAASATTHIYVGGNDLAVTSPVNAALNVGETEVAIVSKAENGDERIYKVTVTRAQSPDATLSAISSSTGTLNTPFTAATHSYSVTVSPYTENVTLSASSTDGGATITFNGNPNNPYPGNFLSLNYGNNIATFTVVSQDGSNTVNYTVNVIRKRSSDATLSNLSIPSDGTINEVFNASQFNYTGTVPDSTYTSLTLTIYRGDITSIVKVNDVVAADPLHYIMTLHGGANTFQIVVTSQDTSATNTYNLVVTRAGSPPPVLSPVANLLALNISAQGFSKNFNFSYESLAPVQVPNKIASVNILPVSENSISTVTVNGVTVPYDNSTGLLPLVQGDNLFTIEVTSQDGAHNKTYSLHVTRLPFADVSLASLGINKGALSPAFAAGTFTYNVAVPANADSTITVTPVAASATARIVVDGDTIKAGHLSATVNLFAGGLRSINVTVTAADGVTSQIYRVRVTRPNPTAYLSNIVLSQGSLTPAFSTNVDTYTASVDNSVSAITVTPVTPETKAVITVNGIPITNASPSATVALNLGPNTITTVVTSSDGAVTKTHTITVTRVLSSNAGISSIGTTPGTALTTTTGTGYYNYAATVGNTQSSIRVTAAASHAGATIKINDVAVTSGTASQPIALTGASTVITIVITAQDGVTSRTYTLTVNKVISSNAGISSLSTTPGTALTPTTGIGDYNYAATVGNTLSTIRVTAVAADAGATIQINDVAVISGTASQPIALSGAATPIKIVITAQDGTTSKTYMLTVNKIISTNAGISSLSTTPATALTTATGTGDYNYAATVGNTVSSIRVTAVAADAGATIKINNVAVTSGTASQPIALTGASTAITIVITAQDGTTSKTVMLTVNKVISNNAGISSIGTTPGTALTTTTGIGDYNYAANVSNAQSSIRVTAVTADAGATIKIDNVTVNSGTASQPIALSGTSTTITIIVTAQNGTTSKTYTLTINKVSNAISSINPMRSTTDVVAGTQTKTLTVQIVQPVATADKGIVVHQALSPNGDGVNDVLTIEGLSSYPDNQLSVINTAGTLTYHTMGYGTKGNVFEGRDKSGTLLKPGTFYYILEYKDGASSKRKTGYIVIKY